MIFILIVDVGVVDPFRVDTGEQGYFGLLLAPLCFFDIDALVSALVFNFQQRVHVFVR